MEAPASFPCLSPLSPSPVSLPCLPPLSLFRQVCTPVTCSEAAAICRRTICRTTICLFRIIVRFQNNCYNNYCYKKITFSLKFPAQEDSQPVSFSAGSGEFFRGHGCMPHFHECIPHFLMSACRTWNSCPIIRLFPFILLYYHLVVSKGKGKKK